VLTWDYILGILRSDWPQLIGLNPIIKEKIDLLVLDTCKKIFLRERYIENAPTDFIILFLGRICVEDFCEIAYLASAGLGIGAQKLLRGLYERVVTLVYLTQHPEEGNAFYYYNAVHVRKEIQHLKRIHGEEWVKNQLSEDFINRIEEEYQTVKNNYIATCGNCGHTRPNNAWTRLDIASMAENIDLGDAYHICYYRPTLQAHSTVVSLLSRMSMKEDGSFNISSYPPVDTAVEALQWAHVLMLKIIEVENNYFKMNLEDEIQARFNDYNEIWNIESNPLTENPEVH
jgi:hypothetical protein